MSLQEQQSLENAYVMHTFGRKPVEFVRGEGMRLFDDKGREYLDFLSGIGVASLGHCHPAVVSAVQQQAETLIHVSNYYYIEHRGQVAHMLSDMLNDGAAEADRTSWQTFFANSGAEANECAIKLARLSARRRAEADGSRIDEAPRAIVTLDRSFHGRTLATLAATAQPSKQELFQPLPDGFISTPRNDVAALERLFAERGDDICAVMLEVVQGESGVHPCDEAFLQAARRLTREAGAVLICDEVQCGVFRCGTHPFAFQRFGIVPDIVTVAKGVASGFPCGMCCARAETAAAFSPGDHGSTFGGSCLSVAAAEATLAQLAEMNAGAHVEQVGTYARAKLAGLPHVAEVRGLGLMLAFDLDESASLGANELVAHALQKGLVVNATGPRTVRLLPPLVCDERDVDELIEKLVDILA